MRGRRAREHTACCLSMQVQDPATNDAFALFLQRQRVAHLDAARHHPSCLPPAEVEGYLFSSRWRPVTRSKDDGQPPVAGFSRSHWVADGLSFLFAVRDEAGNAWSFEDMQHAVFNREIKFAW